MCPESPGRHGSISLKPSFGKEDPEKLTYLMQELYRVLKDDGKQPTRTF
jgi:hypothetical protein